jgi:hypothetical protein
VKNEVVCKVEEERNILHTIKRMSSDWIWQTLLRNCLLKHVFEERIERTGRRGRRHKQLPDYFKEKTKVLEFKEEAQARCVWEMALEDALYL